MRSKYKYNPDNLLPEIYPDRRKFRQRFIIPLAGGLYKSMKNYTSLKSLDILPPKEFTDLGKAEKSFWYEYAETIPYKLKTVNLFIRPFENFCRTCIITDKEIEAFAKTDKEILSGRISVQLKEKDGKLLLTELNYLMPGELKKIGYEIVRQEEVFEINFQLIKKLAKAIHSRYLHEIRLQTIRSSDYIFYNPLNPGSQIDFEDLPDEAQYSNIDNAAHIPTKLLSIGYKIRQVKKGFRPVALHLNPEEVETMARVEHLRWSWEKRLNGWTYGRVKDEIKKTHPSLVPYEQLSESEKGKDRELVKLIPAFLKDIDYEAFPVSPNRIRKLSYAIKPQSSIHKILDETREMNEQIKSLFTLTPEIEEMIRIRNEKIEEAIREVESSYNYAQHIQETYLPDDLYVRETLPDSFILFKPKDIVSGDFYFISRQGNFIIFAVADCTGHGIPGAMLSTLGYGILDEAVNEVKHTDPPDILHHLYSKIHRYLRNDTEGGGISDDMDIILCTLDTRTNTLTYSGVKNSLYCISRGELTEYPAQNQANENCEDGCHFKSTVIHLNDSDTLYLFSDGYPDQLGGKKHKRYQTSRLKSFLQNIQVCSMPEQSDKLYEEIEKWREENDEDQTDDILVMGIRI
jgi:serine phosphatase RsbU (regulator of sigma subunit)